MKPLRQWIEDQLAMLPGERRSEIGTQAGTYEAGMRDGFITAMSALLKELQAREDAERERVNENVNALDDLAGHVLNEKEGGAK